MQLHRNQLLRRLFLPLLAKWNPGDITIRHHYTGDRLRIHSYRHKGYWYHGKQREADTMRLLPALVRPGMTVLEIGGHVGYVTLYLAELAGASGRVYVFEPGTNNLPYLRRNVGHKPNVTVVEKAAGKTAERRRFYLENLTGQNNSFFHDFHVLKANVASAFARQVDVEEMIVDVVRLDDFCRDEGVVPGFVKIDVEGAELDVLEGATGLLRSARPALMVEFQMNHEAILRILNQCGYRVITPTGTIIGPSQQIAAHPTNTFCLHEEAHRELLARICCETGGGGLANVA